MAASDEEKAKKKNRSNEPDYTVGLLMSEAQGIFYIEDIIRVRKRPAETEGLQKITAVTDGHNIAIREEQEPGSSGITTIDMKARNIFVGYNYQGIRSTGSKILRAQGFSAAAERGQIKIVKGCRHVDEFFDEMESFPGGLHDDMVDAASGAYSELKFLPQEGVPLNIENYDGSYWADEETLGTGYFRDMKSFIRREVV
jgi:predicted phage terminase large subunit-like protein